MEKNNMLIYNLILTTELGSVLLGSYSSLGNAQHAARGYYRSLDMEEEMMQSHWYQLENDADMYYCQLTDSSSGLFDDSTLSIRVIPLDGAFLNTP